MWHSQQTGACSAWPQVTLHLCPPAQTLPPSLQLTSAHLQRKPEKVLRKHLPDHSQASLTAPCPGRRQTRRQQRLSLRPACR